MTWRAPSGKGKPTIEEWELGFMFGAVVIRGYIDSRPVMAMVRWWANLRFGVSRESLGAEDVWKAGGIAQLDRAQGSEP